MAETIEVHSINESIEQETMENNIETTNNGSKRYIILVVFLFALALSFVVFGVLWYSFHPTNSDVARIALQQGSHELSKYLL